MRKVKTLVFLSFAMILMAGSVSAQPWMTEFDLKDGEPSFYEIQDAFNAYWAKRDYEKGKGFKQFKRWENFMEPRVDKDGYFPHHILLSEWEKVQKQSELNQRGEIASWTHMGPDDTPVDINSPTWRRGSGRINCISFHPTDSDIMFVGAPSGGFWKTTDGGLSWETTTDHLASIGVSDIAVHPTNPDTLFIATGDGDARDTYSAGILKSTDMGDTWEHVMLDFAIQDQIIIRRLIINPNNPDILVAASNAGILYTSNGGVDWEVRASGHFKDVEFKPGDPDYLYASTYEYSGGASIYRSENGGVNWTSVYQVSDANRIELAVSPNEQNWIYAVASDAADSGYLGFYKSTNSGGSWTQVHDNSSLNLLGWSSDGSDGGGQGWYDLAIAADPNDADNVFVGGVNIWKSNNGGLSWNISSHWYGDNAAYVHADHHTLDYHPLTGALFSGNDGGLHKSTDIGNNWSDLSDGLQVLQIYRFGNSATNPNRFVTGSQDNGSMRYDNGDWRAILGGDGMECLVDYTNDQVLYASYYYGAIHRSTNGGQDFTNVQPVEAGEGAWVTPYVIDPMTPQILYAGFSDVYKTTDRGSSWSPISNNLTGGTNLQSLAVAPSNQDIIYAATFNDIYKTENGGGSWANKTSGLPGNSITYITVNPSNPNMLWVSLSGFSDGEKIYYTDNGGNTWTNYSEGLPSVPANCLVYEMGTNHALYAGTELGVFYRNAGMSEWILYSQGLPNVIVNELEIQYGVNKLRAATYGRGVWESDLFELVAPPVADFSYSIINGCEGIIQFASISSGAPDNYRWEFGDGAQSFDFSPTNTYDATGNYDVKLVVSNALGEDSITQTISLNPTAPVVDFSSDVRIGCEPTEVEFYNLSVNALSYLWEFGDGESSDIFEPEHSYTEAGVYDVKLTAYTTLCPESSELKIAYISFDPLNTSELNMPEGGSGPEQVCCEGTIYDNGGPEGLYSNNTSSLVKIKPANADQIAFQFLEFDVEAGSADECDYDRIVLYDGEIPYSGYAIGEFCNTNPPVGVYITDGQVALIKQYTDPGVTENGFKLIWQCLFVDYIYDADETNYKSFTFTDISTNYPDSWEWDFDDGNTSTDQHPQHTFAQDGIYDVSLTITNEQGQYTETKSVNVGDVNVEEITVDEYLKLYPNPVSNGKLFVQFVDRDKNPLAYEIFSLDGKLIKRGEVKESKTAFSIDVDGFASGVYTLKLMHGKDRFVRQFNNL